MENFFNNFDQKVSTVMSATRKIPWPCQLWRENVEHTFSTNQVWRLNRFFFEKWLLFFMHFSSDFRKLLNLTLFSLFSVEISSFFFLHFQHFSQSFEPRDYYRQILRAMKGWNIYKVFSIPFHNYYDQA